MHRQRTFSHVLPFLCGLLRLHERAFRPVCFLKGLPYQAVVWLIMSGPRCPCRMLQAPLPLHPPCRRLRWCPDHAIRCHSAIPMYCSAGFGAERLNVPRLSWVALQHSFAA